MRCWIPIYMESLLKFLFQFALGLFTKILKEKDIILLKHSNYRQYLIAIIEIFLLKEFFHKLFILLADIIRTHLLIFSVLKGHREKVLVLTADVLHESLEQQKVEPFTFLYFFLWRVLFVFFLKDITRALLEHKLPSFLELFPWHYPCAYPTHFLLVDGSVSFQLDYFVDLSDSPIKLSLEVLVFRLLELHLDQLMKYPTEFL